MTDDEPTTDERIVNALREREQIVMTATDLADELGVHRTTVLDHLHDLDDDGRVASIDVGGNAIGWYLPGDRGGGTPQQYLIPTYHEYVRRPVDKRGRVTVGSEYARKKLTFAILDSPAAQTVEPGEWDYANPMKYHRTAALMEDTADDRGRVSLGRDWAEQEVSVAVLEVEG